MHLVRTSVCIDFTKLLIQIDVNVEQTNHTLQSYTEPAVHRTAWQSAMELKSMRMQLRGAGAVSCLPECRAQFQEPRGIDTHDLKPLQARVISPNA